jgi:hypothetical protein
MRNKTEKSESQDSGHDDKKQERQKENCDWLIKNRKESGEFRVKG